MIVPLSTYRDPNMGAGFFGTVAASVANTVKTEAAAAAAQQTAANQAAAAILAQQAAPAPAPSSFPWGLVAAAGAALAGVFFLLGRRAEA